MGRRKHTNAFFAKGFYFSPGEKSYELRAMIYSLVGKYPDRDDEHDNTAQELFEDMTQLFTIMLDKSELYLAVRGGSVFWSTVMSRLDPGKPMPAKEVANIVNCHVKARKEYAPPQGDVITNDLTRLVDQWIEIDTVCQYLPAPQAFQLTFRTQPSPPTTMFQNLTFQRKPWPPAYFSVAEKGMVTDPRIRPLIDGRCIEFPGGEMFLPSKTSMPAIVRAFITGLALESYHPGRPWRLALTSVGSFLKDGAHMRLVWPSVARAHRTLDPSGFSIFADGVFKSSGAQLAIGLLTP